METILLDRELRSLEQRIKKMVRNFTAQHSAEIPKTHKLTAQLNAQYSTSGFSVDCNIEINKRQKTWSEMIVDPLTKRDWNTIFKNAFFSKQNTLGNSQASRFLDYLKRLEKGGEEEEWVYVSRDKEIKATIVKMRETDRTQINRILDMCGLTKYGLVNYRTHYGNSTCMMAKFW